MDVDPLVISIAYNLPVHLDITVIPNSESLRRVEVGSVPGDRPERASLKVLQGSRPATLYALFPEWE